MAAVLVTMRRRPHIVSFDGFELDCDNRELRKRGSKVEVGSRYFDALMLLTKRRGELVTKNEFMDEVWHGVPVTDEALTQCIRTLRRALGDNAANPRLIETVPKHGYRFIANLAPQDDPVVLRETSHVAGTCTVAGLAAGALAGLFYGLVAATGGGGQVLILAGMVGALGLLAGAGLGAGLAVAITWRGRADGWAVAGSAIGGISIGGLGNLVSREGVGLLSGVSIINATGPFEGAILGTATGLVALAALTGRPHRTVIAVAVLGGAAAAVLIVISGGTLLSGSLQALELGLPGAQLRVDKIGVLIGEPGFTATARGLAIALECQLFILAIGTALLAVHRRSIVGG